MRIDKEVTQRYPGTIIGLMAVTNLDRGIDKKRWNALREAETSLFRSSATPYQRKQALLQPPLSWYAGFYKKFKKTYPVLLQRESILLKGKSLHSTNFAVETMFMAEVKHGLLVGGHDLEKLSGSYTLKLSHGKESFTRVTGEMRTLNADDIYFTCEETILSSLLEGQDYYTRLTKDSRSALYCVYGVGGVTPIQLDLFFQDLTKYTLTAFPMALVQEWQLFHA